MKFSAYTPDSILSLKQLAKALRVDPRAITRIASQLGGRRFGRSWRFRWGTVMEYFNAYETQKQRWQLAGEGSDQRPAGGQQTFSGRPEKRPRMDGGKEMGSGAEGGTFKKHDEAGDAFGLRIALGLG